uniref:Serine/threonine-protein kinase ATM n=1 Tax=Noccaea caerulescens TaxID=107243 RepID=A0A1J3HCE1_NOCCA
MLSSLHNAKVTETSESWNVEDSSEAQILPDAMLSSLHNAKAGKEIPEPIRVDPSDYEDVENFIEVTLSCSNVNDDSKKVSISDVKESSEQQILPANGNITGSGSEEQTGLQDCSADSSAPNALILKFADSSSVPSEEKLNSIFNRYGPLRESETQIMKKGKKAKVVFKRGEDAKTAFSSSGKYSTFGPSLLSYSLKYVCPKAKQSSKMTN